MQEQLGLKLEPRGGQWTSWWWTPAEKPVPGLTLTLSLIARNKLHGLYSFFVFFFFPLFLRFFPRRSSKATVPKPQFEVATVRPNKSGESGTSLGPGRVGG